MRFFAAVEGDEKWTDPKWEEFIKMFNDSFGFGVELSRPKPNVMMLKVDTEDE